MMTTQTEALKLALEALENNKQTHYYCEDNWYSCPQHEDGCANDSVGDECNCGADKANAKIDKTITAIKEALAQPEQEPVAYLYHNARSLEELLEAERKGLLMHSVIISIRRHEAYRNETFLYTTPPQRTWVGLTDEDVEMIVENRRAAHWEFLRQAEALLKEKNT